MWVLETERYGKRKSFVVGIFRRDLPEKLVGKSEREREGQGAVIKRRVSVDGFKCSNVKVETIVFLYYSFCLC
jgi:hypothetical protein